MASHPEFCTLRVSAVRATTLRSWDAKGAETVKSPATNPAPTVTSADGDGTNTPVSAKKGTLTCNKDNAVFQRGRYRSRLALDSQDVSGNSL